MRWLLDAILVDFIYIMVLMLLILIVACLLAVLIYESAALKYGTDDDRYAPERTERNDD